MNVERRSVWISHDLNKDEVFYLRRQKYVESSLKLFMPVFNFKTLVCRFQIILTGTPTCLMISSLCEMCPNTEFFLVRIFPHSDWIRRDTKNTEYFLIRIFPHSDWYGPEKTPYLDNFHAVPVVSGLFRTLLNNHGEAFLAKIANG